MWYVPGSDRHFAADRIMMSPEEKIIATGHSEKPVEISWSNPDGNFDGSYYLIVQDAFNNGFVDVVESKSRKLLIFPGRYDHQYLKYHIKASDCRASGAHKIEIRYD